MVAKGDVLSPGRPTSGRRRRTIVLALLALALLLVGAAPLAAPPPGTPSPFGPSPASGQLSVAGAVAAPRPSGGSSATLGLNVTSARVGAQFAASGSGYLPNATVNFTAGGGSTNNSCRTSASGVLESNLGGTCTAQVPATPNGNTTLFAVSGGTLAGTPISLGGSPLSIAVDSPDGLLFVSDSTQQRLDVLGAANLTQTGTIDLAGAPGALAFDPVNDRLYVAEPGADRIAVVDAASGASVGNVSLPSSPSALAVAANASYLFVALPGNGSVVEIALGNDSEVAAAPVGQDPTSLAYDPVAARLWVSNDASSNLSVLDVPNLTLVRTVALPSDPLTLLFDPATNETFVGSYSSSRLAVYSAEQFSRVGNISLGDSYVRSMALDPTDGEIFATVGGWYSEVAVIGIATDTALSFSSGPIEASAVAYDPAARAGVVASEVQDYVQSVEPATYAGAPLRIDAGLLFPGPVESDTTAALSASGLGADSSIVRLALNGTSLDCLGASVGTCLAGALTTAANGSWVGTVEVPAVALPGTYTLQILDQQGNSANASVEVLPAEEIRGPTLSRPGVDVGESVNVSVSIVYGAPPYSVSWTGLPFPCTVSGANVTCAPAHPGTYSISATAVDSNGVTAQSANVTLPVSPPLSVGNVTASVPWLAVGGTVSFAVPISGGAPPYTVDWQGVPPGCPIEGDPLNCTPTAAEATTLYATVTDSNGVEWTPAGFYFTVDQYPVVVSANVSAPAIDLGSSVTFQASAQDGAGGYSYLWTGVPPGCLGDLAVVRCTPTAAGTYSVTVEVTDVHGFAVRSVAVPFQVFPDPSINVTLGRTSLDVGETVDLYATVAGGSGGNIYRWQDLPPGCSGFGAIVACVPTGPGLFDVRASVTDSLGTLAETTRPAALSVWPALNASVTVAPSNATVGAPVEFSLQLTGGARPISVTWDFPSGGAVYGTVVNYTFLAAGRQVVSVWVNDSTGASRLLLPVVEVTAPAATPSAIGWATLGPIVGVTAAGAVVVGALLARRRLPPGGPGRSAPPPPSAIEPGTIYREASAPGSADDRGRG